MKNQFTLWYFHPLHEHHSWKAPRKPVPVGEDIVNPTLDRLRAKESAGSMTFQPTPETIILLDELEELQMRMLDAWGRLACSVRQEGHLRRTLQAQYATFRKERGFP